MAAVPWRPGNPWKGLRCTGLARRAAAGVLPLKSPAAAAVTHSPFSILNCQLSIL